MGRARLDHRWRSDCGAAACLAAALVLSGCSSFSGGSSDGSLASRFSSLFPGSSSTPATQANAAATGPTFNDDDCPSVDIRAGAGTLMVAGKPGDTSATDLRYQLSFNQMARQCTAVGTTVVMKVGVQGRIVLGPAGASGQVDIPLRYAVVQEGPQPKTIVTKFKRIAANLPPGETNVPFSDVEENLSFPLPPLQDLDAYVVYVGFDEVGDANEKKPAKKPAAKRK
jgi:hypothetical protein